MSARRIGKGLRLGAASCSLLRSSPRQSSLKRPKAIALAPLQILPGHGPRGGVSTLEGQRRFLVDLYAAVGTAIRAGKFLTQITIDLPEADRNWIPQDLSLDIEATFYEITKHAPAGSLLHEWR